MANVVKLYYVDTGATYKQWELLPNKLLVVESIADYLATKTALTINNFQYVKNELEIGINVDLSQSYSQPKTTTSFKYVSIQNDGEQVHYYFVKKIIWRSKSAVRFELVMDVLNTFKENTDYVFKPSTKITREHKPRFKDGYRLIDLEIDILSSVGSLSIGDTINLINDRGDTCFTAKIISLYSQDCSLKIISNESDEDIIASIQNFIGDSFDLQKDASNYYRVDILSYTDLQHNVYRIVDYIPENINPILQCGSGEGRYVEANAEVLQQDWYLLYRNQNDPSESQSTSLVNPVECYLIPENATKTNSAYIEGGRLIPSFLEEGKYYYFLVKSGSTFTLSNGVQATYFDAYNKIILLITKAGGKIFVQKYFVPNVSTSETYADWTYDDIAYIDITGLPVYYNVETSTHNSKWSFLNGMSFPNAFNNSGTYNEIEGINAVDRTDAKNIKLIKLPYCPYQFSYSGDTLLVASDTNWDYASITQAGGGILHALKLNNLNTPLHSEIYSEQASQGGSLGSLKMNDFNPSIYDYRQGEYYESKLYNSEFRRSTYVYDSFAFYIQLEKCDIDAYIEDVYIPTNIDFDVTRTINSRFMFTFTSYKLKQSESNYSKVLPIARNNEEVLYNVPYINYIRTGFNYDVKAKNTALASNIVGLGLSGLSVGVSLFLPSAPLKVAGVIASLVSVANSVKSTIVTTQQNEDSIRRKLTETQNQASSVAGSDDVDLMSIYANNRLKYLLYEPTPEMKKLLYDLFFYAGYSSTRMGVPTHNNRVNFDYLECDANIEKLASIPDECLNELINCFKNGVTYLHKTERSSKKWDFAQEFENWEADFFD